MKKEMIKIETIKRGLALAGILLWIGAVSPEVFLEGSMGCIKDSSGKELTRQEAILLLEKVLYGDNEGQETTIIYKSKLWEQIQSSLGE